MVRGLSIAVSSVPRVSQCADTHRIALGVGRVLPISRHPLENSLSSMAFIGLPCPTNSTGIGSVLSRVSAQCSKSCVFIMPPVDLNPLLLNSNDWGLIVKRQPEDY